MRICGCDVKSLNLIVWRTIRPNQPFRWLKSSPLAMSVMTLFKAGELNVTLLGDLNREVKIETASYKVVRVQALIVWLTYVNR